MPTETPKDLEIELKEADGGANLEFTTHDAGSRNSEVGKNVFLVKGLRNGDVEELQRTLRRIQAANINHLRGSVLEVLERGEYHFEDAERSQKHDPHERVDRVPRHRLQF